MSKKVQVPSMPKPNAMAANFALAHRFVDRKKQASKNACRNKKGWNE